MRLRFSQLAAAGCEKYELSLEAVSPGQSLYKKESVMELIKKLREATGAGILDCKKALAESGNDIEKAVDFLRKKGIASASKRLDREAKEGIVIIETQGAKTAMIELNCETDFVARTDDFRGLAVDLAKKTLETGNEITAQPAVKEKVSEVSGKTGEKMTFDRAVRYESSASSVLATYVHSNQKIGVIVELEGPANEQIKELGKDLAMQIAAVNPRFISREQIPAEMTEKEKSIYQVEVQSKPQPIQEKIIAGKLEKWYSDICLVDQVFVKDEEKKIKDVVAAAGKTAGAPIKVKHFTRFQVGA